MEEETKEVNPYLSNKIDTLFFNDKGLKTPYEETYEDVFGKPMTTNKSNINLGSYINGISKEEAKSMKPDVYKNGEIISGPSLENVTSEENQNNEMPEPLNSNVTMEDLFNKVNEGIINDKVYKRLNVNVTGSGKLVVPQDDTETVPQSEERINPVILNDSEPNSVVETSNQVSNQEPIEELVEDINLDDDESPIASVNEVPVEETPVSNVNEIPVETPTVNVNETPIREQPTAPASNNVANNSNYEVVRTAYDNAENTINRLYDEEGAPIGIILVSFLIPFVGIIIYLTKHNKKERYARNCLLAGLFGVLLYALMGVAYSLFLLKTLE